MIHDDKTHRNFGMAFHCPHCDKGWHGSETAVLGCRGKAFANSGAVQSGGSNSTSFSVPTGVTDSSHLWGGGGGTGKCEVIPYRESSFRTPLSPYDHPAAISSPKGMMLVDGATFTGETRYNASVSSGCPTCDYNFMNQNVSAQRAYERWYDHYIEAQQWRGDGFVITHLEFIMNQMMRCVTPDTVLPPLPSAKIHVPVVEKKKSGMSRTDKWCDLVALPLLMSIMGCLIVLLVISAIFFAVGVRTVSYHDFDMIMAGSIGFPLLYNFIRAGKTYINSRK